MLSEWFSLADAIWTLGPGTGMQTLTARIPDVEGTEVVFTANAVEPAAGGAVGDAAACGQLGPAERGLDWRGSRYAFHRTTGGSDRGVFVDKTGRVVTDPVLVLKLARAVWVYDHVVADPTERGGKGGELTVRALLDASRSMNLYLTSQDLLARVFVRSVAAVVTNGASLTGSAGGLTWRVLRSNLANLHKFRVIESETALKDAQLAYQRLQGLTRRMSPETIDVDRAQPAFDLYSRAYVLEVGYGPLLSALLPKSGRELVVKAVNSAGQELLATVAPYSDAVLTWQDINRARAQIEELTATIPQMRTHMDALAGAVRYLKASKDAIAKIALEAGMGCSNAPPSPSDEAGTGPSRPVPAVSTAPSPSYPGLPGWLVNSAILPFRAEDLAGPTTSPNGTVSIFADAKQWSLVPEGTALTTLWATGRRV
jgi:hypothetical protein